MTLAYILAAFAFGVLVGLIIGPDSEREYAARVEGWLSGADYVRGRRDRDAALRRREAAEAEGQQPGPCEDTASPDLSSIDHARKEEG